MTFPFITKEHIQNRIGARLFTRNYDDNNDGNADTSDVDRLRYDASAKVATGLAPTYSRDELSALADETTTTGEDLIRVTLDFAVAYAAQRHPEVVQRDWEPLMKYAKDELKDLRNTMGKLATTTPPANEGARIRSGNPDDTAVKPRFSDDWGDF